MRILHIGQLPTEIGGNYSTGMGKVVYELSKCEYPSDDIFIYAVNALDKNIKRKTPIQSRLIGYRYNITDSIYLLLKNPIKNIAYISKIWSTLPYNIIRCLFYMSNFHHVIRNIKPDVVHIHSIDYAIPLYLIKKEFNIPVLLTCHGIFDIENPKRIKLYQESLKCVDYVSVLTKQTKKIITDFKFPEHRTHIITNGVDSETFYYSESDRKHMRKTQGVNESTTLFLTVGSLQKRKGQIAFLKDLINSGIDFGYWMIGDGPDRAKLEQMIIEYDLQNKVKLLGYIDADNLYKYYSAADVYAHASEQEGQALSEIEAYTAGLKIIVNKAVEDTIVNPIKESNLYFIDTVGSIDWKKCVKWIEQPQQRKTRPNFDWQLIAQQYTEIYHKIKETCHT